MVPLLFHFINLICLEMYLFGSPLLLVVHHLWAQTRCVSNILNLWKIISGAIWGSI